MRLPSSAAPPPSAPSFPIMPVFDHVAISQLDDQRNDACDREIDLLDGLPGPREHIGVLQISRFQMGVEGPRLVLRKRVEQTVAERHVVLLPYRREPDRSLCH